MLVIEGVLSQFNDFCIFILGSAPLFHVFAFKLSLPSCHFHLFSKILLKDKLVSSTLRATFSSFSLLQGVLQTYTKRLYLSHIGGYLISMPTIANHKGLAGGRGNMRSCGIFTQGVRSKPCFNVESYSSNSEVSTIIFNYFKVLNSCLDLNISKLIVITALCFFIFCLQTE